MNLSLKDKKWAFTYEEKEYLIPGPLYPLACEKEEDVYVITEEYVSEIRDARLLRILDTIPVKVGRCYENSERIYTALKKENYEVGYFSGWLFTEEKPPVHHAWVVVSNQDVMHIIDSTYSKVFSSIMKKTKSHTFKDVEEFRTVWAELYKKELKRKKRNTDRMTTGKPPKGYVYVGVESDFEKTLEIYDEIIKTKNHPSYTGGMKLGGDSVLQEMLKKENP